MKTVFSVSGFDVVSVSADVRQSVDFRQRKIITLLKKLQKEKSQQKSFDFNQFLFFLQRFFFELRQEKG